MKTFLFLGLALSVSAHAGCDYSKIQNVTCEMNYRCAEAALKANQDVDTFTNWSKAHQCQDELKFASLFASFDGEVDETSYSTAKTDLPVIEDAPVRSPAQTKEQ